MKFKAVTNDDAPFGFFNALDCLRGLLEQEIAYKCFGVPMGSMGPAELYVQMTDRAAHQWPFINYNASGITIKEGRNFELAMEMLKTIICDLIMEHWREVGKIQIMIVIHASTEDGNNSKLFESTVMFDSKWFHK